VLTGQIGRKLADLGGQRDQLAAEFFGLRHGQLGCGLGGGNPAAPARLLFVVVAVKIVIRPPGANVRLGPPSRSDG
jgi:hypothetical protein